jgi:D-tyrosyl-tRNA(Tyr) deacylase
LIYKAAAEFQAAWLDVKTGRFQTDMDVELLNDGPVTVLVESRRQF